ncbi:Glycine dehydrogenase mitochondrial [Fasciola hepatica]|uniref:Glycine cleavage system P protein n=1 Tax=Fasciola hepatica TaxID=6192 RepID=A0A4E0S1J5_FASHE|nr:Glycine dehydrogenase mitochondrial [Fasciola hepatica]
MEEFIDKVIPKNLRLKQKLKIDEAISESELLRRLERMMNKNQLWRSYIGQGYYGTLTPTPILRNVFENPGWYTSYTPYQPEISQGRLEALLNFQTMVAELTGLNLANASLLDEGSAAAEAMTMAHRRTKKMKFLVDRRCHPQTIAVVRSRADGLQFTVQVTDLTNIGYLDQELSSGQYAGCLIQYPDTDGNVAPDHVKNVAEIASKYKALTIVATDLLALTLIQPPGKLGADIAVGSSQRFGVPVGFGGPHAAFFATKEEFARSMPGRMIGISKDSHDRPALRLTLQVREQHIRRDKATSNICTAQALLADMASFYAVYHGPEGLKQIAQRVHRNTMRLSFALNIDGYEIVNQHPVFDTIKVKPSSKHGGVDGVKSRAANKQINLRYFPDGKSIGISLDETVTAQDMSDLFLVFGVPAPETEIASNLSLRSQPTILRTDQILSQSVFNSYHSETELLRYMKHLENKDISLIHSMISLGSCTLKLNATTGMLPCSWSTVNQIHPFAPVEQTQGYVELIRELEQDLAEITGFDHVCLTPNSGAMGEYSGLRTIARYLASQGQGQRKICLIPTSAHGTNPASARMAGMTVQPIQTTKQGTFDMTHLKDQVDRYKDTLGAIMVTYPSTFGVFDSELLETIDLVHKAGGQVYLDGANMNAQVGLCRPGDFDADVSHLNLHKTFGIPHGGGGPGVGPICVKSHLAPFLPQHAWRPTCLSATQHTLDPDTHTVCSAPFGSASLLPISWAYIKLLGRQGLRKASEQAILNANYMLQRLRAYFPIKFVNQNGLCAHEFIIDCSEFEKHGVIAMDIAKRLIDYGFHSPTMSWPVPGSLMIEPTESESLAECDRLCDALINIRKEMDKIAEDQWPKDNNPLKNAPHTVEDVTQSRWDRPYSREEAAFPAPWHNDGEYPYGKMSKVWPTVGRLNDVYGDTHLCCVIMSSAAKKYSGESL